MPTGPTKGKTTAANDTGGLAYPLAQKGDLIGRPGEGTHSFTDPPNNWESDNAVDIGVPEGTDVIAVDDGVIGPEIGSLGEGGRFAGLRFHLVTKDNEYYYAHLSHLSIHAGQHVKKGDVCGKSGSANGVAHLHWASEHGNPENLLTGVRAAPGTTPSGGGSGGITGGVDLQQVESISKAAAFSAYLAFPGVVDSAESLALTGERSLMNDQPLLPFVKQICEASLRRFQSMPNGNFYAFYPDYFGGLGHRTPYWRIEDIEIIEGQIQLSDDQLATHVYIVGDTVGMWDGVNLEQDGAVTAGVVNMFTAFGADFINGPKDPSLKGETVVAAKEALMNKDQVTSFLKKYGARPYLEEAPMVRSHYYELFLAYQKFCLMWSAQFKTNFVFTYMPELFPGGIVAFPDHGIQMFVEEVEHIFDYTAGFETHALLTAPAALPNSGLDGVTDGMIRAGALTPPA